ncbi:alpha/beta hydrolase family protein [Brevundimonas lenta]|uniref:Dipeptidyl aminopeptidase n=1 Tax=Brevundimonas lenta TaxID=424796 RepID=A0A7W6JFU5_9CAUL|nr:dipeptidyl aminopeptidase [Brevundimonas lenta]MBB4084311.1 hypothetical protein [Brevundimonas lenta]
MLLPFFDNPDLDFVARTAVGHAAMGTSDIGPVLETLSRCADGDPTRWHDSWSAEADRFQAAAVEARAAGRMATAAAHFLSASEFYDQALAQVDGMPDADAVLLPTFRLHRAAWDEFVAASEGRHLPVDVPFEGGSMPGYLFRPDAGGGARPTLVVVNGSDGALSGLWATAIRPALDRGWNAFVFDGPGQQSLLFERGVPFRPDWEAVLTPVLDTLVARADVDAGALLGYGISQGGYWLPRALAFEHRLAAAVVDGGVVDVARPWNAILPPELTAMLKPGERDAFNAAMAAGPSDPERERTFAFRARPYGGETPYDVFAAVQGYALGDLIGKIATPLLITEAEGEQFFPGQSQELFDQLPGEKEIVRFTRDQGADFHCQPMARALTGRVVTDFLAARIG